MLFPFLFRGNASLFGGFFFRDPLLLGSEFFRDALLLCGDTLLFQPILLLIVRVSSDTDTGQHQNGNNGEYIRALLFPCCRTALRLLLFPLLAGDTLLFGLPFPFKTGGFGLPLLLLLPDAVAFDMFLRAGIDQLFGIELRVGENLSYFRVVHGCHHLGEGTAFFADLQLMAALLDQRCPIHRGMRNNLLELNRVEFADFGFLSGDRNSLFETVGVGFRVGFRIGFRIGFLGVPGLERGDRVSGLDALNLFGDGLWDADLVDGHEDGRQRLEPDNAARNADDAQEFAQHGEEGPGRGKDSERNVKHGNEGRIGHCHRALLGRLDQIEVLAGY